ncbi:MAG: HD domain-containing protein [Clostridiales Family XIII bacterium]|jgi:3'-5' exoribonuclease|nr:HD domain-containing protein [Clostridiales Family XIII bacterium]
MKEHCVERLKTDEEIVGFFMVRMLAVKIGSNKKQYLDLLLADNTGEITAKKWDVADTELPSLNEIQAGDVLKVKAIVTEWSGMRQLKIIRLRKAVEQDGIERSDFIKAAPEKPEEMYAYLLAGAEAIGDADLRGISVRILEENREKLMYYPAAAKNHHSEMGGLLYHMKRMLMMGERYCQVYENLNRDLVTTGVIIHDMEKLTEMIADTDGIVSEYSFEGQMLGHLIQGVKQIARLASELGVPEEKAVMLEHMILSHHYEPEFGSPKKPLFPEAEILHYLDIVDARMYDMQAALNAAPPGGFSEKVRTLENRRLYRPRGFGMPAE